MTSPNSVESNLRVWDELHPWKEDGDEWKGQAHTCNLLYEIWKKSVVDRLIAPYARDGMTIVEIAPGHGRWTEFLLPYAARLILVDISANCLTHCRKRFLGRTNVETHLSDGRSLPLEPEDGVDLVWSFDSFVHIAPADIRGYLQEMSRVLKPGGTVVIHHAGRRHRALRFAWLRRAGRLGRTIYRLLSMGFDERSDGWRSDVSAQSVRKMAALAGLQVVEQFSRWGDGQVSGVPRFGDCVSVLRRPNTADESPKHRSLHRSRTVLGSRLPDFLCLGAQKAGTSTLHAMLSRHDQIFVPRQKEVHYFTLHSEKSIEWYANFFRYANASHICGDITPYYLFHPAAPERIRRLLPHVRLVVLLRDPVARALSGYFHSQRRGEEHMNIEDAFDQEEKRLAGAENVLRHVGARHASHQLHSYLSRSRYELQLARYRRLFPKQQLHVVNSEDFFKNPERIWKSLQQFLELEGAPLAASLLHKNQGSYTAAQVPESLRDRLRLQLEPTYRVMQEEYGITWK